jgi:transglutaminase-like putative cysteine protease
MWLHIEHTTTFSYEAPIVEAYTELRLRPLDSGGQRCSSYELATTPVGIRLRAFRDYLGNEINHFDILEPHARLVVQARSDVFTPPRFEEHGEPSPLELYDYLHPTSYVALDGGARLLASTQAGSGTAAEQARALMRIVHSTLVYERGATSVQTRVDEVLSLGRGVCQDFAHVLIAACRCNGIPARYVSGYVHDPTLDGVEAASHAWVDVYDPQRGWISLDPTHDREQNERYVRVAVGRDYADVPPTRGVFKGHTEETLSVKVDVGTL